VFLYRIYYRPTVEGAGRECPWMPHREGGHNSRVSEWTDKGEAEAAFAEVVRQEVSARAMSQGDNDVSVWVGIPHVPLELRLVRIYADEVKEFK
jgi:hypothetical protein